MKDRSGMRKLNAIISLVLLVLFVAHAISGALVLSGMSNQAFFFVPDLLVLFVLIHTALGIILSLDSFHAMKKSGTHYPGAAARFWAIRVSGTAIVLLLLAHVLSVLVINGRLREFGSLQLVMNLAFVLAVAVHVLCNIRPLLISLGLPVSTPRVFNVAIALGVVLCVAGLAFVVYFLRWQVV